MSDDDTSEPVDERLNNHLHDAVSGVFMGFEGDMLTKCVVLAEVITQEGERAFYALCTPEMKPYEVLGFMEHAKMREYQG